MRPTPPLRRLREHLGLTQGEFGASLGLTGGRICQVENRRWTFRAPIWLEIASKYADALETLGLGLHDLMEGSVVAKKPKKPTKKKGGGVYRR